MEFVFSTPWLTIVERRPNARIRLFCFPHAGGGTSAFRMWSEGLPSTVEVCPIQLPGREGRISEPPELMELMLPTLRADCAVDETYVYSIEPPLDCPISAFGGLQDSTVSRDCLAAWRNQTRLSFSMQMFPGDHFFLHTGQPLLLQTLYRELHSLINTVTRK